MAEFDVERLSAVSRWLSDQLDQRATLAEQVPICGAILAAAAALLPAAERDRLLRAHLAIVQQLVGVALQ